MRSMMKPRYASSDARRGVGAGEVVATGAVAAAGVATGEATSAEGTSALSMGRGYVKCTAVLQIQRGWQQADHLANSSSHPTFLPWGYLTKIWADAIGAKVNELMK
jgi:hypothetical protein